MEISDQITITNEDCMEMLSRYPYQFFDIMIVDPPYGIPGNSHRRNKSRSKAVKSRDYDNSLWDQPPPDDEYFSLLRKKSKKQFIWGANYFPEIVGVPFDPPRRHNYAEFIKDYPTGWMIWDKVNITTIR